MTQVTEAYILGIKEGRAYLNANPDVKSDAGAIQCHIDTLRGLMRDHGGTMKDVFKGELDFWRNIKKDIKMTIYNKFPITLTEHPHQGKPTTWVLYDEKHLNECIQAASNYTDWAIQEGLIEYADDSDGELKEFKNESWTLDAYIDWLRHDLSYLEIEE